MPTLPNLETSQSVFNNVALRGQQIDAQPADFGGVTAQAAQGLAQGAASASNSLAQAGMRQLDLQREADANSAYTNYADSSRTLTDKLYSLQGRDAIEQAPQIKDQLDQIRNQYRDNLKDPVSQRLFDQVSTRHTQNVLDSVSRFADVQSKNYQKQVSDGMVNSFQQDAARHWNDPNAFNGALANIVVERTTQGQTEGQPLEFTNAVIARDVSATWIDRLKGMAAAGTAQTALTLLNNGEDWTDSTGRTRHTDIRSQIEPNQLPAIQTELASHAADQIGVGYGNAATTPTAAPAAGSLGVRNNNPGNLKDPATGKFQTFASQQQGVAAADANLAAYGSKHGIDTIDGIVNRWAPKGDGGNDPAAYATAVSKATGIAADAKVDLTDKATRTKILNAMFDVESPGWRTALQQPAGAAAGAVSGTLPVGNVAGVPNAAAIAPPPVGATQDPEQMRADQDARAEQARQAAEAHVLQLTGDAAAAKRAGSVAASTVVGNTNAAIGAQQARQRAAADSLTKMLVGDPTTGAQPIKTVAQLVADPQAYANYRQLSPQGQATVIERLAKKADVPLTQEGLTAYYQMRGQAVNNPNEFLKQDLSTLFGKLPEKQIGELINIQMGLGKGDVTQQQKSLDWGKTRSEVDDMLKPMGWGTSAKAGSDESKTTEQFYGKLQQSLEQYHDSNGKYPDATTTRKLAAALLVEGTQGEPSSLPSWLGGPSKMPAFQSPDTKQFHPPTNEQGWSLMIDKNGNQAYVSPDRKQAKAVQ